MNELTRTRRDGETAWQTFLLDGAAPESVRPEIRRSWQRVRAELHVDPGLRATPRGDLDALARAESDGALAVASRLVSRFADRLAPDGHVVAYCDAGGVMLAVEGAHETRARLELVNFAPGSCWTEGAAGTNGIGTALAEKRPVEVFAAEHFVEVLHAWTCASVPVRVAGRVVGVVDITSPWAAWHPALLLTAEAVAQTIGSELEAETARSERAVLLQVARDALQARDDFLSVASHELKTPLTPLRLHLQQLQRRLARGDVDADQLAEALRAADGHVGRLVGSVDRLLETSRAAREPLRLAVAPADLAAIVRAVVERHRPEAARRGCDLRVAAPPEVMGRWDAARLAQAVEALVVNAMTYAPGKIEIEVRAEPQVARVRVRDHGPGIAPEDRERIFLPFERAVSCRHASGYGLGLHAARRVAEAHGGSIAVESAPGNGSTFELALPADGGAVAATLDDARR